MSDFRIRKANLQDFPEIRKIYAAARQFMREHNNPNQWGTTSPREELLLRDLREGHLYVVLCGKAEADPSALHRSMQNETPDGEQASPVGVFALFSEPDPTYAYIEDGSWLIDTPYATIHSIASDGTAHGVLQAAVDFAEPLFRHIRIDTHADNYVMQGALEKRGFSRRGIIYLADGNPRIAYERVT